MYKTLVTATLLSTFVTGYSAAQSVTLQMIVDETTPVRGWGHSPALDGGMVAFLGEVKATGLDGVYMTPADGQGPHTLIVDANEPLPNVPGEAFVFLDNPEIHEGIVTFTAGYSFSSTNNEGIYQGSGGPLTVVYDHAAFPTEPNPFEPIVDGAAGLVFRSAGGNSSDFLTWSFPYSLTAPDTFSSIVTGPMPGGGDMIRLQNLDGTIVTGGGIVVFSAELNHPGGVDGGVYTWDPTTETTTLVANWTTTMTGTATLFQDFWRVDTDGARVAFVGSAGNIAFGGHEGVYVAPVGGGPLEVVAQIGDLAPGSSQAFAAFASVAVEGDLVLFEASLGSVINPTGNGIYGFQNGTLFKVLDSFEQVDGQDILGAEFDTRGLDGNQLALRVTFVDPAHPTFWLLWGVYVATIGNDGEGAGAFCDASDGSLASCPCSNPGGPKSGCDIQQGTGGVKLSSLAQEVTPLNRATLQGAGFPAASTPTSIVIRAASLDPAAPVVFGDGLRCIGTPVVRLAATFASGGVATHTFGHGSMAPTGTNYYQLWFRNTPAPFCTPDAFNLSNGSMLTW